MEMQQNINIHSDALKFSDVHWTTDDAYISAINMFYDNY